MVAMRHLILTGLMICAMNALYLDLRSDQYRANRKTAPPPKWGDYGGGMSENRLLAIGMIGAA